MNHEIVTMGKPHTWAWMRNHSRCSFVDALKAKGFGSIAILPYYYWQNNVKNPSRKVVINSGSFCRVISYTNDWNEVEEYK